MTAAPWLDEARRLIGVAEIAGSKSNIAILSWAKKLGGWIASFYKNDDTPWCGLFVAHCVTTTVLDKIPANPLGALNWATFGRPCAKPSLGAILVFKRTGGGHVGFYLGETPDAYYVLGGNQNNKVCQEWIAKERCVAVRWPATAQQQGGPVLLARGGKLSTNEA